MNPPLNEVEVRILGALLEKEVTTPDNYPLSISALMAACNQSSNRDPVMELDESTLTTAIVSLRRRSLLRAIQPAGSRVTKYQHLLADALNLDARERAIVGVLALRGPQTPGELHARTARLADFADMAQLEGTLEALISREPEALVMRLPRRAGQKETRFAHLLSGDVVPNDPPSTEPASEAASDDRHLTRARDSARSSDPDRVAALEREVSELRGELATLRQQFEQFRSQF